jgi:hypothetical protein
LAGRGTRKSLKKHAFRPRNGFSIVLADQATNDGWGEQTRQVAVALVTLVGAQSTRALTVTLLHSFTDGTDSGASFAGLVLADGSLDGTSLVTISEQKRPREAAQKFSGT